jgi:hypothetical protein
MYRQATYSYLYIGLLAGIRRIRVPYVPLSNSRQFRFSARNLPLMMRRPNLLMFERIG